MNDITSDEQLEKWLAGESVHRGDKPRGECCPDFSCCYPRLLAPFEIRQIYVKAFREKDYKMQNRLLFRFLGELIAATSNRKVYIAGSEEMLSES